MHNSEPILKSLAIIYDGRTDAATRNEAHQALENQRECIFSNPRLAFQLADVTNPFVLRHFAFNALDNFIKCNWLQWNETVRQEIKRDLLVFIKSVHSSDFSQENRLIREALARCITEIAKKDLPQRWPLFLTDIDEVLKSGLSQCQIVLTGLNRLLEDVVCYQNVESQNRRRDLQEWIVANVDSFLLLCVNVLSETDDVSNDEIVEQQHVVRLTTLEFLSNFIEVTPANDIKSCNITSLLCQLLLDRRVDVQNLSVQCLERIAARKTDKKGVVPLFFDLFSETAMSTMLTAAKSAADLSFKEEQYQYLKSLSSLLATLGNSLCQNLDSTFVDHEKIAGQMYMQAILAFFTHPSLVLRFQAATVFGLFIKKSDISKLPFFKTDTVTRILRVIPEVIQFRGFPSKDDSPFSDYSRLDFDDDAEFKSTFNIFRDSCMIFVRKATLIDCRQPYSIVKDWLMLRFSIDQTAHKFPLVLEWEGMIRFTNNVIMSVSKLDFFHSQELVEDSKKFWQIGIQLLESDTFMLENCDLVLSTWSTLFPLLVHHTQLVPTVVGNLFRISFMDDGGDETIRKVKHHAMHDFVHLCAENPKFLSQYVVDIVNELSKVPPERLTLRQRCLFAEGLTLLGNEFFNFDKQKNLIEYLLESSVRFFSSSDIISVVSGPENFAKFVGLFDQAPQIISNEELYFSNRKDISNHVTMLVGVLNRCRLPRNVEDLRNGGYLSKENGEISHPIFSAVKDILPQLFCLARCLNGIYSNSVMSRVHPSFDASQVLNLSETEKSFCITNVQSTLSSDEQRVLEHMRVFFGEMTEKIQVLLGLVVCKFGWQFYELEQAPAFLTHGVLSYLNDVLDQRLKFWIRRFFQPLAYTLPSKYAYKVIPVFTQLISHTYDRLTTRWKLVIKRLEQNDVDGVDLTRQEMFLEDSTRVLSRDYLDFLSTTILAKRKANGKQHDEDEEVENNDDEELNCVDDVDMKNGTKESRRPISDLGILLLDPKCEALVSLTLSVFHSLLWPDTMVAKKCCDVAATIAEQLMKKSLDESTAQHLYTCVLNSLTIHGQHADTVLPILMSLGCDLYEIFSSKFDSINQVLLNVTGCNTSQLINFRKNFAEITKLQVRRKIFKQLVNGIIGINIGQKFKKRSTFDDNLPAFFKIRRLKPTQPDFSEDLAICHLFGIRND